MGPKPLSSSRRITFETNAITMKMAKMAMIMHIVAVAYGELRAT